VIYPIDPGATSLGVADFNGDTRWLKAGFVGTKDPGI
jgi:hypothetical protein